MNEMKTQLDFFEEAFSWENLLNAYARARRGKQKREQIERFGWNLEANVQTLRTELIGGTYVHGPYRHFIVADSKRREIKAAPFRDRVVHQTVVAALEPIFERRFIFDTYACRRDKGTRAAIRRFEHFLHLSRYALTMDVSRFFASIDHAILIDLLARRIPDTRMMDLCRLIVHSSEDGPGRGIPIGNLTSQLFANVYLNELDQHVKHCLRERRYVRYMDDFSILADDKTHLHAQEREIGGFLQERLHLSVHPKKSQVEPTERGIGFLGYRIFPHHRLLRTSTVKRFVARAKLAKRGGGCFQRMRFARGSLGRTRAIRGVFYDRYRSGLPSRDSFRWIINRYQII
jgi:retron-type reverse transcriptase